MAPQFTNFEGHRLAYETFGRGPRAVLLIHGLLMSRRMQEPLARAIAGSNNMAITVDLAGHGRSDDPLEHWDIPRYARALEALLDELEIDDVVLVGASLGANITLQMAANDSKRVRGFVAEMPALENAMIAAPIFFSPFVAAANWAEPVADLISRASRLLPDVQYPFGGNVFLDLIKREPATTLSIIRGLYYGPIAPATEVRRSIEQPALVIGHKMDPIHPIEDAEALAADLPNSRWLEANSIAELRVTPARITNEVIDFIDDCWRPRVVDIDDAPRKKTAQKRATKKS